MNPKRFLIYVAIACLLALSACEKSVAPVSDVLTAADDGSSVEVNVGDILQIYLSENKTTGHEWETEDINTSLLQYIDEQFQINPECRGTPGCGGMITIRFKAIKKGLTALRLVYRQTEEMGFVEDGPAVDSFEIIIKII